MVSNTPNPPCKNRQGVGELCSVLIRYLHSDKLISDIYTNEDNHYFFSGVLITNRQFKRVNRRDNICIFMEQEYFKDKGFHCVQMWFRLDTEGSSANLFGYI